MDGCGALGGEAWPPACNTTEAAHLAAPVLSLDGTAHTWRRKRDKATFKLMTKSKQNKMAFLDELWRPELTVAAGGPPGQQFHSQGTVLQFLCYRHTCVVSVGEGKPRKQLSPGILVLARECFSHVHMLAVGGIAVP